MLQIVDVSSGTMNLLQTNNLMIPEKLQNEFDFALLQRLIVMEKGVCIPVGRLKSGGPYAVLRGRSLRNGELPVRPSRDNPGADARQKGRLNSGD